ncbi:FAD binding domain-containing protein [Shimia abyssi]|uniref:CO/xanthine dehydrogenase FAD-binding subunit n=1 Tax=Shimia abyssi TaxID=1662395 RepID=A0A2P8F648_9RHOB|nr:xanthine dehydrogenase family protein subunit M [Shimia abyssi]PSL17189.1 CO/xanthine dehydrogenase FAD-binding subunit [Shimia abyssi]
MGIYHRPCNLKDALDVLAKQDVTIAAGCTDLFPATEAQALSGPVLDITDIVGMRGISESDVGWRFGAATTWSDIVRAGLPTGFDMLVAAAREVGSVQIQNAGTIGGNLCNASPAADGVPALLALDATVEVASKRGVRVLAMHDFLTGVRQTALEPGEMVVAVHVPRESSAGRSVFRKLGARKYLVISIAMVAARVLSDGGVIREAAIAVGACSPVARRLGEVEAALVGVPLVAATVSDGLVAHALAPISDVRGSDVYRADAAGELVRRALRDLAEGAA